MVMGVVLALVGSVFTGVLWRAWQRAEETRRWIETPCLVVSSQLVSERRSPQSNIKHTIQVRYRYEVAGRSYLGHRIRRVDGPKGDLAEAQGLRQEFSPGQKLSCWVQPEEPAMAILRHDTRAPLYSIWFPLLFVIGGLRMAWAAWRA
jgi:Protein of unknown function (DUF3592)